MVFFDKVPFAANLNKVCIADEQAATLAADYLISKAKKSILALLGHSNISITVKRQQAFIDRISLQSDIQLTVRNAANSQMAEAAMEETMRQLQKPDAVFCMSDEILIGVMKVVQQMSLRIPEDIGVISLSNGFFPTLYYPEIAYVETSGCPLGKLAFNHMMNVLNNGKASEELNTESVLVTKGSI